MRGAAKAANPPRISIGVPPSKSLPSRGYDILAAGNQEAAQPAGVTA
jgi:hypothetical protein